MEIIIVLQVITIVLFFSNSRGSHYRAMLIFAVSLSLTVKKMIDPVEPNIIIVYELILLLIFVSLLFLGKIIRNKN